MKNGAKHYPVMVNEAVDLLVSSGGGVYADLTFGGGGHSHAILNRLDESGRLVVFDLDRDAFERALALSEEDGRVLPVNRNFGELADVWEEKVAPRKFQGILADLGLSMYLLRESGRGFSFQMDEPLDMRFGDWGVSAREIVNEYSFLELKRIFEEYGEERRAGQIARAIVETRRKKRIETSAQLADLVVRTIGKRGKIHPATKVFQALRIEANRELENLENMLNAIPNVIDENGRVVIITYHSIEDRIVKNRFMEWERANLGHRLIKKVLTPSSREIRDNPASRSAKLRCFQFGREK